MYQQAADPPMTAPQRGRIGVRDELIDATAGLHALNARGGGVSGGAFALPALLRVARLARSLQTPVARTVVVGDDRCDLELKVRAVPGTADVELHVEGVATRTPRSSWLGVQPDDAPAALAHPAGWLWSSDAALVLTRLSLDPDDRSLLAADDVLGLPLTRLVRLLEDDNCDLPLLAALAARGDLRGQAAVRRDMPGVEWSLDARVVLGADGQFRGFEGRAVFAPALVPELPTILDAAVTRRLQTALRTPLDRIVQGAETIGAQLGGPLRRDYLDYAGDIARAGRHLLALVDDLADLEAVEAPDFAVGKERLDLADLARRGAGLLAVRAGNSGVRIDAPPHGDDLPAVGDFTRTLQIVVNLIGNAVRYSPSGSVIWVRTERDEDTAVLIVADQGKGIAAADHVRIFDKFERVDPGEAEGSGLGLYISRRLARAMGGDIVVDSGPGQGARFVLTLPAP